MKSPTLKAPPETWNRWLAICDAIESEGADLDIEHFAEFYAHFKMLQHIGVPFDEAFCQRVEEINRSNRGSDADSDHDDADWSLTDAENTEDEPAFDQLQEWGVR